MRLILNEKFKIINKENYLQMIHLLLMSFFRLSLLYLFAEAMYSGDKDAMLLIGLTSLTSFYKQYIKWFTKVELSLLMQIISTLFILATAFFGTLLNMYNKIVWWDTLMHGLSGILLFLYGLMFLAKIKNKNPKVKYNLLLIILFSLFFSITAGTIWEIMEFSADTFLGYDAQRSKGVEYGVLDTMIDTIANTFGAIIISISTFLYFKRKDDKDIEETLSKWFLSKTKEK